MESVEQILVQLEPLANIGAYCEWCPLDLIDPHDMAELSVADWDRLQRPCVGIVLNRRWHEFVDEYSGWCYWVQQIDPSTGEPLDGKAFWIDEEHLTFTGDLRRRTPDASQIEVLHPDPGALVPFDLAQPTPLWWRSRYGI